MYEQLFALGATSYDRRSRGSHMLENDAFLSLEIGCEGTTKMNRQVLCSRVGNFVEFDQKSFYGFWRWRAWPFDGGDRHSYSSSEQD